MEIAYRIYPLPHGTVYSEEDVCSIDDVVGIFDYCQILEASVSKAGWEYLIDKFGIEGLFEANKISGWLNSESLEEFALDIEYEKETAYTTENDHNALTSFFESAHFPAT